MPRKTKATQKTVGGVKAAKTPQTTGPTQGQLARLIQDSFDLFSNELLTKFTTEQHFSQDDLIHLKTRILAAKQNMQNRAIDQLLKHY